jgi:hypothetical protein
VRGLPARGVTRVAHPKAHASCWQAHRRRSTPCRKGDRKKSPFTRHRRDLPPDLRGNPGCELGREFLGDPFGSQQAEPDRRVLASRRGGVDERLSDRDCAVSDSIPAGQVPPKPSSTRVPTPNVWAIGAPNHGPGRPHLLRRAATARCPHPATRSTGANARRLTVEVPINEHFATTRTARHSRTTSPPEAGNWRVPVGHGRDVRAYTGDCGSRPVLARILQQGSIHRAGRTRTPNSVSIRNRNDSRTARAARASRQQGSRRVRRTSGPSRSPGSSGSTRPRGTHRHARRARHERSAGDSRNTGSGRYGGYRRIEWCPRQDRSRRG